MKKNMVTNEPHWKKSEAMWRVGKRFCSLLVTLDLMNFVWIFIYKNFVFFITYYLIHFVRTHTHILSLPVCRSCLLSLSLPLSFSVFLSSFCLRIFVFFSLWTNKYESIMCVSVILQQQIRLFPNYCSLLRRNIYCYFIRLIRHDRKFSSC